MNTIRSIFQLKWRDQFQNKTIAHYFKLTPQTIRHILQKGEEADLSWSLTQSMSNQLLHTWLYPSYEPSIDPDLFWKQHPSLQTSFPVLTVGWALKPLVLSKPKHQTMYLFLALLQGQNPAVFAKAFPQKDIFAWTAALTSLFASLKENPTHIAFPEMSSPCPLTEKFLKHHHLQILRPHMDEHNRYTTLQELGHLLTDNLQRYEIYIAEEVNLLLEYELETLQALLPSSRSDPPKNKAVHPLRLKPDHQKEAKPHMDQHIQFQKGRYSVPHTLPKGTVVQVIQCDTSVYIYHQLDFIAAHPRVNPHCFSTIPEHLPMDNSRLRYLLKRIKTIGPKAEEWALELVSRKPYPQHGFRTLLGVLQLAKKYTPTTVESACQYSLAAQNFSYKGLHTWLKKNQAKQPSLFN